MVRVTLRWPILLTHTKAQTEVFVLEETSAFTSTYNLPYIINPSTSEILSQPKICDHNA